VNRLIHQLTSSAYFIGLLHRLTSSAYFIGLLHRFTSSVYFSISEIFLLLFCQRSAIDLKNRFKSVRLQLSDER